MEYYLIGIVIAFLLGIAANNSLRPKETILNKDLPSRDQRITNIQEMLSVVKKKNSLPLNLSKAVLNALIEIANTPNWESQIDEETISNLYDIYQRWINAKSTEHDAVKLSKAEGFNYTKYWEGTWEEYKQARINGEVDEFTKVTILTDTGVTLEMDDSGQIEENFT